MLDNESNKIADDIVNVATACKQTGCDLIISALLPRWDKFNIKGVNNDGLKELCLSKNILLIEHGNLNARYHLNNSKLPLKRKGSGILASKFLKFFNNSDWLVSNVHIHFSISEKSVDKNVVNKNI